MVRHNKSIVEAKRARDQLTPLDWVCKGSAWFEDETGWASVEATRGEESITVVFCDGKFYDQQYSIWDPEKSPEQNGRPERLTNLQFNVHELTDKELARELAGRKVTWWNRLAKAPEQGVIGDKLRIEHTYTGGEESGRQVHFIDFSSQHFRSFHVDALMRVK